MIVSEGMDAKVSEWGSEWVSEWASERVSEWVSEWASGNRGNMEINAQMRVQAAKLEFLWS